MMCNLVLSLLGVTLFLFGYTEAVHAHEKGQTAKRFLRSSDTFTIEPSDLEQTLRRHRRVKSTKSAKSYKISDEKYPHTTTETENDTTGQGNDVDFKVDDPPVELNTIQEDDLALYRTCTGPKVPSGSYPETIGDCSIFVEEEMFVNFDGVASPLSDPSEQTMFESITLGYIAQYLDNEKNQIVRCVSIADVTALDEGRDSSKATAVAINIVFEIDIEYAKSIDGGFTVPNSFWLDQRHKSCQPERRGLRATFETTPYNDECSFEVLLLCNACSGFGPCYCPCQGLSPQNRHYIQSYGHFSSNFYYGGGGFRRQLMALSASDSSIELDQQDQASDSNGDENRQLQTSCDSRDFLCLIKSNVLSLQDAVDKNGIITVDSTDTLAKCSVNRFNVKNGKEASLTCDEYNNELGCDLVPGEDFSENEEECTSGVDTNRSEEWEIDINNLPPEFFNP